MDLPGGIEFPTSLQPLFEQHRLKTLKQSEGALQTSSKVMLVVEQALSEETAERVTLFSSFLEIIRSIGSYLGIGKPLESTKLASVLTGVVAAGEFVKSVK